MTGMVWQRGKTWTYAFSVSKGGTRRQISKGGFRTKKLAQEALTEALADHQRGELVDTSRLSLERYLCDEWLPLVESRLKPSTADGYRRIIEKRVVPHLGDARLTGLTAGEVASLHRRLRADGLGEGSILNTHRCLSKALEDAARRRLIARNPARDVDTPRPHRREMKVWTVEDLHTFLRSSAAHRLAAAWTLAVTTGLRRGEVLGLRWSDIDFGTGQLAVRRSRVLVDNKVVEGEPKSGRARSVALDEGTVALLRRHRRVQLEERMAWGEAWEDSDSVFTKENGVPLHPGSLSWHFKKAVGTANVRVIRFHDLRHTHATLALQEGVHPKVVQERLGHSSIAITLDLYSHVVPGMQEDAAAKVGAVVFGT